MLYERQARDAHWEWCVLTSLDNNPYIKVMARDVREPEEPKQPQPPPSDPAEAIAKYNEDYARALAASEARDAARRAARRNAMAESTVEDAAEVDAMLAAPAEVDAKPWLGQSLWQSIVKRGKRTRDEDENAAPEPTKDDEPRAKRARRVEPESYAHSHHAPEPRAVPVNETQSESEWDAAVGMDVAMNYMERMRQQMRAQEEELEEQRGGVIDLMWRAYDAFVQVVVG